MCLSKWVIIGLICCSLVMDLIRSKDLLTPKSPLRGNSTNVTQQNTVSRPGNTAASEHKGSYKPTVGVVWTHLNIFFSWLNPFITISLICWSHNGLKSLKLKHSLSLLFKLLLYVSDKLCHWKIEGQKVQYKIKLTETNIGSKWSFQKQRKGHLLTICWEQNIISAETL